MVQALAFAEMFLGLILADAAYKGVTVSAVVKGEAENAKPKTLAEGSATTVFSAAGSTGSSSGETLPASGSKLAPTPSEAAKNAAFGPSPGEGFTTPEFSSPTQLFGGGETTPGTNRVFGPQPVNSPNSLFGTAGAAP